MDAELGARIRSLREAVGMRATDLAAAIGLDATALSKVENGRRALKSAELALVAQALHVSPLAILEPDSLLARLPVAARQAGGATAMGVAYDRLVSLSELHVVLADNGIHNSPHLYAVPTVAGLNWLEAAERLAAWAHQAMPPTDGADGRFATLVTQIENTLAMDVVVEQLDGDPLCGAAITDDRFPLVLVNAAHPLPRSLFTLAHELGHVLARHNGGTITLDRELTGSTDEERTANAFAAIFLMPEAVIDEALEEHGRRHPTLVLLAAQLGVSFQSLIYRLHNLGVIDANGRDQLMSVNWRHFVAQSNDLLRRAGLSMQQVAQLQSRDFTPPPTHRPAMLIRRANSALGKGIISANAYARLVGADPEDVLADMASWDARADLELIDAPALGPYTYEDDVERFSGDPL